MTLSKTIFYSILFGLVMEFQINILLLHRGILGIFILYAGIGILTYYTFPFIIKRFKSEKTGFWVALVLHGILGLTIIEWGFMGNTPTSIPSLVLRVIAQLGMFAWWATIAGMPYLLQQPQAKSLRKNIFVYYAVYAVVSTGLVFPFGLAPIILIEPIVYVGFFYFYYTFSKTLPVPGVISDVRDSDAKAIV